MSDERSSAQILQAAKRFLTNETIGVASVFQNVWDETQTAWRVENSVTIFKKGDLETVYPLPEQPAALVDITRSRFVGDEISPNTAIWAERGLVCMERFGYFVRQKQALAVRLSTASWLSRRRAAQAIKTQSAALHLFGVGSANAPGGWYFELLQSIENDLERYSST